MVFPPKRCFNFRRTSDFENLFELVVQCGLKDGDVENSFTQRDWRGMRGDESADDFTMRRLLRFRASAREVPNAASVSELPLPAIANDLVVFSSQATRAIRR